MTNKEKKEFYRQYCDEWTILFQYNLKHGNVKENEKLINEKRKLEKSLGIIHKTNEENRKLLVLQIVIYLIAILLIIE